MCTDFKFLTIIIKKKTLEMGRALLTLIIAKAIVTNNKTKCKTLILEIRTSACLQPVDTTIQVMENCVKFL